VVADWFRDNDVGFLEWIHRNLENGYVLIPNTPANDGSRVMLHRARCRTFSGQLPVGKSWTSGTFEKFCSNDRADLDGSTGKTAWGTPHCCKHCLP
jgi:hypothetical protein